MNVFEFSKAQDFPSMIIFHTLPHLFLHFLTPNIMSFPNLEKVSSCFKFFGYRLFLMIFVVSSMFLLQIIVF